MAFCTGTPYILVLAAVYREIHIVMIKGGGLPRRFIVAQGAIRREACRGVIGVVAAVVVGGMAAIAGGWRVGVIAVVTGRTIVGNGRMGSIQWPVVVVDGEGRRHPLRRGGVTHVAVRGNGQRHVVRVHTGIIGRQVAALATGRRVAVVATDMAGRAIV